MARLAVVGAWSRDVDHAAAKGEPIAFAQIKGTPADDHLHGRRAPDEIDGLAGDDVLNGRYGDDTLDGGKGDDVLKGSTGRDVLTGGAGDDVLFGGTEKQEGFLGIDSLDGGGGNDRLYGGYETDILTGGAGRDRFSFVSLSDSTVDHPDTIIDFEQGADKLVFRGEFHRLGGLHFIGDAEFSMMPGEVRFVADNDSSAVLIDVNGDGQADTRIFFASGIQFQASDFSF